MGTGIRYIRYKGKAFIIYLQPAFRPLLKRLQRPDYYCSMVWPNINFRDIDDGVERPLCRLTKVYPALSLKTNGNVQYTCTMYM